MSPWNSPAVIVPLIVNFAPDAGSNERNAEECVPFAHSNEAEPRIARFEQVAFDIWSVALNSRAAAGLVAPVDATVAGDDLAGGGVADTGRDVHPVLPVPALQDRGIGGGDAVDHGDGQGKRDRQQNDESSDDAHFTPYPTLPRRCGGILTLRAQTIEVATSLRHNPEPPLLPIPP